MSDLYGVVGNPIAHSKSPVIHQGFASQCQQDMTYQSFLLSETHFESEIRQLMAQGLRGFNITVPFKERAVALADRLDPMAAAAQAVNTLALAADGSWVGYNTDGLGLVADLMSQYGVNLSGIRILVLGAGGAVRGVLPALLAHKPSAIHLFNRTAEKAEVIAQQFKGVVSVRPATALESGYDLIINGTSASLSGASVLLPSHVVAKTTCCYDMMYGKGDTPFMTWARGQKAAKVCDGLGMLVEQAAVAFGIWRGVVPNTKPIYTLLSR